MTITSALAVYVAGIAIGRPRQVGIASRIVVTLANGEELLEERSIAGPRVKNDDELALVACGLGLRRIIEHPTFISASEVTVFTEALYVTENVVAAMFSSSHEQPPRILSAAPRSTLQFWKALLKELRRARRRVEFRWVSDPASDLHFAAAKSAARQIAEVSGAR